MIRRLLSALSWLVICAGLWFFVRPILLLLLVGIGFANGESDSLADYPSLLDQWKPSGLVEHFPVQIPATATRGWFSAAPGFLQGGAHMQLRLRLPPAEVLTLEQQAAQSAKRIYPGGGNFLTHVNRDRANGLATTHFHTAGPNQSGEFPSHYTLYVLHTRTTGASWNHGETTGIAISQLAKEVIYWVEDF